MPPLRLAILETGRPPGDLAERFGDYPAMFRALLGMEADSFDVAAGAYPANVEDYGAYLVTGSPAGVYEDLPWIPPLMAFIRAARGKAKLVGICFGHQAMAQALGGQVEKSAKGWGVGLTTYPILRHPPWMDQVSLVSVPASHQDQVVVQPPGTEVIAASTFTPFAGLAWTDGSAISFQFHPEFSPEYAKALIAHRYDRAPDPDAALASLDAPNDNRRVGDWIRRFLDG